MPRQRAPWFRLYSEMIHSKKVRTMGAARFEQWMYLLCLASDSSPRGRLPGIGDIAYSLRWSEKKASEVVTALHKAHFLDLEAGYFWCHDWHDWQFKSDNEADNKADYRRRQNQTSPDVATGQQTGQRSDNEPDMSDAREESESEEDTESESETDQRESKPRAPSKKSVSDEDIAVVQERYPNVDVAELAEDFRDYVAQHPRKYTDWPRALSTWARKESRNAGINSAGRNSASRQQPPRLQAIDGRGQGTADGDNAASDGGTGGRKSASPFAFLAAR